MHLHRCLSGAVLCSIGRKSALARCISLTSPKTAPEHARQVASIACDASALQVARHILDGGRLPIPELEQLPGPGGEFQAPGPAGGIGLYLGLMERCWAQRPDNRPTFPNIIASLRCVHLLVQVQCSSFYPRAFLPCCRRVALGITTHSSAPAAVPTMLQGDAAAGGAERQPAPEQGASASCRRLCSSSPTLK